MPAGATRGPHNDGGRNDTGQVRKENDYSLGIVRIACRGYPAEERKIVLDRKESWTEKLGKIIATIGNAILMNLLFILCCLPVVTIGQAWCGLMSAIRYNIRGEKWLTGFWTGFKTRFIRGTVFWVIGALACMFMLNDFNTALLAKSMPVMIASGVMFLLAATLTMSALVLNVYIPTDVNNWTKNTMNMLGKAPLQVALCAALAWAPVVVCLVVKDGIWLVWEVLLVILCVYFSLVALGTTMLLKDALVWFLVDARAKGILTAEEGANAEE